MITAQLPDGTSLQFPDDTSQDVIHGVVKKHLGVAEMQQPQQTPIDPRTTGIGRTFTDQGMQGLTAGFGDEASDALGAAIAKLHGMATGNNDSTLAQLYNEARANTAQRLPAQFSENPGTSIGANIAGAALLGKAGLNTLSAGAPAAAEALLGYAKASPYKTAIGAGAASGGLYGLGAGQGDIKERIPGALYGGIAGGLTGPLGAYIGRNAIAPVAKKLMNTEKAQNLLARNNIPTDELNANLIKPTGEMFSKTAGQRSQDAGLQRLENDARAGTLTKEAEKAIREADIKQNREFHSYMDNIANGLDKGADPNTLIEGVTDVVKTNAKTAKEGVNNAYDLAREGKSVKIGTKDIRQGLWSNLAAIRRENVYDLSQMPKATATIKRLARYSKSPDGANISAVKLGEMENWRKQATNSLNSSQDPTERKFLGEMVRGYDNFMESTAENAVDLGDAKAIKAFREAVRQRREYGRLFETNKLVNEVVSGQKSIDDTVKNFMGTGSIKGKREMANNLEALLNASGNNSEAVQNDLKQAFTLNAFKKSLSGYEPNNPNMENISPAKLRAELENIFVHQKDFSEKLYGKEIRMNALQATKELKLISSSQAGVKNPSGSGEWLGRFLRAPGINRIPGIGIVGKAVEAQKQHQAGAKVMMGLGDFIQNETKYASPYWSLVSPVPAAAITNREKR